LVMDGQLSHQHHCRNKTKEAPCMNMKRNNVYTKKKGLPRDH
jgi:hypothetical protein